MIRKILLSPVAVLIGIAAGVAGGIYQPSVSLGLEALGGAYLSLLKLTLMPFLVATLLVGVISLLRQKDAARLIQRIVLSFLISSAGASVIGIGTVLVTAHETTPEQQVALGNLFNNSDKRPTDLEVSLSGGAPVDTVPGFADLVSKFVPDNIFASLASGESLKVVLFCLLFGVALSRTDIAGLTVIVSALKSVQSASAMIFRALNYLLPFALAVMISSQVAKVGLSIFSTMLEFLIQQAVGAAVLICLTAVLLCVITRRGIAAVLRNTLQPLMIAISTRASLPCIPSAEEGLAALGIRRANLELVIPIAFTINRVGAVMYYAIATLFIANIYAVDISPSRMAIVVVGSMLAALASTGAGGALSVTSVALVCDLLGIPSEAAIVLLIAVDPVTDMIRTGSMVYGNLAVTAAISPPDGHAVETEDNANPAPA